MCFVNILHYLRERMAAHSNHWLWGCPECLLNSDPKDRGVHMVIVRLSWFCVPKIDCKRKETGTLSCLS